MDRQEYIDNLLDHYESPRNKRVIEDAEIDYTGGNPGCGDIVRMYAKLDGDDRITDVSFEGEGCTISQAAASIITEMAQGKTLTELEGMNYQTLVEELGSEVVAPRIKCAVLALGTLKAGAQEYQSKRRVVA
ncbi:MAG: iron-sulfur cluster assembly scaffold protein [Chloroflexota bacterium]|jgi:nitrogen fixation NifU-like protein|nr:iron-sulfur cluster assembly scaffold protein [Chloroflexota bacterium]